MIVCQHFEKGSVESEFIVSDEKKSVFFIKQKQSSL